MKFLVMMAEPDTFDRWEALDEDGRQRVVARFQAFGEAVSARGSIVAGEALDRPEAARTVQAGASDRAVTEGPYAEIVEQVGGFYLIDVPTLDDAVELARLLPAEYTIEVRPCVDVVL